MADLVKQQVGYDVVLLDSKCFPALDNGTMRSMEFGSQHGESCLAASTSLHFSLKGSSEQARSGGDGTKMPKVKNVDVQMKNKSWTSFWSG